jgi:catabolite regulation protein CreA
VELEDEQVQGIAIYLTDYNRSITERLAKDPFSDPSQASLTCVATGSVTIKDEAAISGSEGKEFFKERKGLNFFQNKVWLGAKPSRHRWQLFAR